MIPQLHQINYFFIQDGNHYLVNCIAFEDDTYSILVCKISDKQTDRKCIGSFDIEKEPTSEEAKDFLIKALK